MFTQELLNNKTFYSSHEENNGNSTGFVKAIYNNGKVSGHFMIINNTNNNIELDEQFNLDYTITADGKIKMLIQEEDSNWTQYSVLKSIQDSYFTVIHQEDENNDGTIDNQDDELWYFEKPSNFPSSL